MRITEQILMVVGYGKEDEDVVAVFDGVKEASEIAPKILSSCDYTLCRVKIIEVVEPV